MKTLFFILSVTLILINGSYSQTVKIIRFTEGFHAGGDSIATWADNKADTAWSVISSAGETSSTPNRSAIVAWTIGETIVGDEIRYDERYPVDIPELSHIVALKVFPNPTNDKINVEILTKKNATAGLVISLHDLSGKNLYSQTVEASDYREEIDLSAFPSGQYVLTLATRAGVIAESFHVQKIR